MFISNHQPTNANIHNKKSYAIYKKVEKIICTELLHLSIETHCKHQQKQYLNIH